MELDVTRTVAYGVCIPLIVLLCVLAALLNLAVFSSRFYVKSRSTSLELTYSLALSDTWTSMVIAGSLFWNSYKPVILGLRHNSYCFPLTLEAFRTGGLLTGVFHLAALACVHYLQIVRPFDHARILTLRQCHLVIVLIWLLPPLSLIVYSFSWPEQGFRAADCARVEFYNSLYFRGHISLIIITLMLTTCIVYWRLLTVVRSKTAGAAASSLTSRGRRTVITATLIFGTFIFGWAPASIVYILTATGMPLHMDSSSWVVIVSVVVLLNIMIKTLTNPIIYATRIPEIRNYVTKRLSRVSRRVMREEMSPARRRSEFSNIRNNTLIAIPNQEATSFIERQENDTRKTDVTL